MKIFSELSLCLGLILAIAPWIHAQDIPWDDVDKTGSDLADLATRDASDVTNAPAGSIAATDAQAAINELDTEKATTAQGALADSATQPGDNVSTLTNDSGYLTTALANPQFAARSPDSGIVFTGSSSGTVSVIPDLKGGDWTLEYDVVVGSAYGASGSGFGILGEDSGNNNSVRPYISGAGTLGVYIRAVTTSVLVSSGEKLELNTAYKVAYTFIDSTKVLSMYVNGVSVYSAALSGTGLSEYNAITTLDYLRVGGFATQPFPGTMLGSRLWNKALTAAEVLTLHRFGWAALPSRIHAAGAGPITLEAPINGVAGRAYSSFTAVGTTGLDVDATASGNTDFAGWELELESQKYYLIEFDGDVISGTPGISWVSIMTDNPSQFAVVPSGAFSAIVQSNSTQLGGLVFPEAGATEFTIRNFKVTKLGVAGSWDFSAGAGYQQRDLSGGKRPMTLTTTGVQRLRPDRQGSVTGSLTWADTHEAKSLLGQKALPSNAIIDAITFVATAGSTGDGITIGTTTDPDQFVTVNTYTTTAENFAGSQLTSPFPGGTATNDLTIVVDPDTANYTGSITTTVTYHLANY